MPFSLVRTMGPHPGSPPTKTTIVQLIIIVLLAGLCLTLLAIRTFRHPPSAYGRPPPPMHAALTAKGTIVPVATAMRPMAHLSAGARLAGQERSR